MNIRRSGGSANSLTGGRNFAISPGEHGRGPIRPLKRTGEVLALFRKVVAASRGIHMSSKLYFTDALAIARVLDPAIAVHDETDYRADQEHHEKDFRDACGTCGDTAKTKHRGDQGND